MSQKIAIYITASCSIPIESQEMHLTFIANYQEKEFEIFHEQNLNERPVRKKIISQCHRYESIYFYGIESFSSIEDFIITIKFLIDKKISFFLKEERITCQPEYGNDLPIINSLYNLLLMDKSRKIDIEEFYIEELTCNGERRIDDDRPHAV
jgi:hypothetical protein